jgi:hypothetical protein
MRGATSRGIGLAAEGGSVICLAMRDSSEVWNLDENTGPYLLLRSERCKAIFYRAAIACLTDLQGIYPSKILLENLDNRSEVK